MNGPADSNSGGGKALALSLRLLEVAAAVVLFALMAMTCIDVAGRYFFNAPLDGATELTRLMLAVLVFAVLPAVCWREDHVSVDLLDPLVPPWLVRIRQVAISLVAAAALAGLSVRVAQLALRHRDYGDTTEYLLIPLYPLVFFIALMSAVAALTLLANALRYAANRGPQLADRQRGGR